MVANQDNKEFQDAFQDDPEEFEDYFTLDNGVLSSSTTYVSNELHPFGFHPQLNQLLLMNCALSLQNKTRPIM